MFRRSLSTFCAAAVLFLSVLPERSEAVTDIRSGSVPIRAEAVVETAYSVKTDPFLELVWNADRKDYEGTYRVGVRGRIGNGRAIRIVPDATFQMTSGKKTRTGTVRQEFTRWAMTADRADTLTLSETVYVTTSGTAAISLPGTAVYRGGIQFTFSME